MADDDKPHYHGHRERLRDRLAASGADAFQDYELLEYVLGLSIPRADTKPLAKRLIDVFGSYAAVVAAEPQALRGAGLKDGPIAAIKFIEASALRLLKHAVINRPVLSSWQALLDYCHADMAHGITERFRILYLNNKNILIQDEVVSEGTVNQAPVYVREVMRRALELGATALILVHNHPSGDPTPSRDDIAITKEIIDAGKRLGVSVHDHVVIGRAGHASFKSLGLI
jgi:DNA repair protein RadC